MQLASIFFARLLLRNAGELTLTEQGIAGHAGAVFFSASLEEIERLDEHHGLLWTRLEIQLRDHATPVTIGGLRRHEAGLFRWQVIESQLMGAVHSGLTSLDLLLKQPCYLNHQKWQGWANLHRALLTRIPKNYLSLPFSPAFRQALDRLVYALLHGEELRGEHNQRFTASELSAQRTWFDNLEAYPLTRRQREAIVCDEDNTLVVAGAGTGKTSTIVGKVAYLLRKKLVKPEEVLLLAFARKARDEMEQRLHAKGCPRVEVRTFHSLGLDILGQATGAKPTLAVFAEDPEKRRETVEGFLAEAFADPKHQESLRRFFLRYRYPQRSEFDYKKPHEYYRYLAGQGLRTLRGERVKSFGELIIADFLTAHGVAYQYEAAYEVDTATPERRQYQPDFYLPQYKVYIEYFGTDRQGRTAPYINGAEYRAGMEWKRTTHRKNGTTLLELFAYELFEGNLETRLAGQLRGHGIPLDPLPGTQLHAAIKDGGELGRVADLLLSFLGLYKSNNWSPGEVRQRAASTPEPDRARAFLDVFEAILGRYTAALAAANEIDFHDMIARATDHVRAGRYSSRFRYVVVDEFQDISRGRAQLLRALLDQQGDRRLFCVGDDWQSIYRFTGSDVGIMTHFQDHFGFTQRIDLDEAFRFSRQILDTSTRFILKNPRQLRKELTAAPGDGGPAVKIICAATNAPDGEGIERALRHIRGQNNGGTANIMLLGRYRFSLPQNLRWLRSEFAPLEIEARTVHTSKGLEADYVIVLDVHAGRYGFPTEVTDDPMINLVLAADDGLANAEERRLLYVALTRARRRVYLVTQEDKRSRFIEELESPEYKGLVEADGAQLQTPCSKCGGGLLVKHRGEFGVFWGCSNYPYCDGKGKTCPRCRDGVFVREGDKYVCSNERCSEQAEACPRCADGILKERFSQYGPFLSCSNWAPEEPSCTYKRDLRGRRPT